MGWKPDHKRMKATYSPYMSADEKAHADRLRADACCFGCGRWGIETHHLMLPFEGKRWRRDHRFLLPVCRDCHRGAQGIHGLGRESLWLASIGKTEVEAVVHVRRLWAESEERRRAA